MGPTISRSYDLAVFGPPTWIPWALSREKLGTWIHKVINMYIGGMNKKMYSNDSRFKP